MNHEYIAHQYIFICRMYFQSTAYYIYLKWDMTIVI